MHVHAHAEHARFHGRSDFGRAACLGAVADHAGIDGKHVYDRMGDLVTAAAVEVADPRAGAGPGRGGPAVGGETADARLEVDGDEVGDYERPQEHLMRNAELQRIDDYGNGGGDALIPAAGVDDHGKLTAVHTRIGPRGRPGFGTVENRVSVAAQKDLPDPGTVLAAQALLGNGNVVVNLTLKDRADLLNVNTAGKFHDPLDREQGTVLRRLDGFVAEGFLEKGLVILPDTDDIGVVANDMHIGGIGTGGQRNREVEGLVGVRFLKPDLGGLKVAVQGFKIGIRCFGNDLKLLLGFPETEPCCDRGAQAFAPAGVRHHHTFYVLNDVAADDEGGLFGHAAQRVPRQSCRVGDRNRLRTAHGGDQFFSQNIQKTVIYQFVHNRAPHSHDQKQRFSLS